MHIRFCVVTNPRSLLTIPARKSSAASYTLSPAPRPTTHSPQAPARYPQGPRKVGSPACCDAHICQIAERTGVVETSRAPWKEMRVENRRSARSRENEAHLSLSPSGALGSELGLFPRSPVNPAKESESGSGSSLGVWAGGRRPMGTPDPRAQGRGRTSTLGLCPALTLVRPHASVMASLPLGFSKTQEVSLLTRRLPWGWQGGQATAASISQPRIQSVGAKSNSLLLGNKVELTRILIGQTQVTCLRLSQSLWSEGRKVTDWLRLCSGPSPEVSPPHGSRKGGYPKKAWRCVPNEPNSARRGKCLTEVGYSRN